MFIQHADPLPTGNECDFFAPINHYIWLSRGNCILEVADFILVSVVWGLTSDFAEEIGRLNFGERIFWRFSRVFGGFMTANFDALVAAGVVVATAATDAVYVMFTAAVSARRRFPAATWSSVWYLLSAFAVISYTKNWVYVCFAAAGSWIGAYLSMTWLRRGAMEPRMR